MLDALIVLVFIAWSVGLGLSKRRLASRDLSEYFLAGRSVSGWRAGLSMAATQFAADTPLLMTGLIATAGIFALWRLWIYGLAFLLMAFVFAQLWRRAGVLTDAELTELRYSRRGALALRVLKALYYGTLINCVVMAMVMLAAVRIGEVFLPWHMWLPQEMYAPMHSMVGWLGLDLGRSVTALPTDVASTNGLISIVAIVTFTALYSTTGGLRSVIATDVLQFIVAMTATLVFAVLVVVEVGGLAIIPARLDALYGHAPATQFLALWPTADELLTGFVVVIGLQWLFQMNSDGTGYLAQRTLAYRSDADVRVAGITFAWAQILLRSLVWLVIGVGLLIVYPFDPAELGTAGFTAGREMTFVYAIDELLPPGVRGLMLAGLLAALASTLDTHMNWGASYWCHDIYRRLVCETWLKRMPGDRELVFIARLSGLLIVVLALIVMTQLDSIQAAWQLSLLFGAGVGPALVARWLWERVNLHVEFGAMAVSLLAAPILLLTVELEWLRLGAMAIVSALTVVTLSLLTPATAPDVLDTFYRRVRPVGFWSETAIRVGDKPDEPYKRLIFALRATLLCAASLYLILIACVRFLFPMPGSVFFAVFAFAFGLLLIPIWLRTQ